MADVGDASAHKQPIIMRTRNLLFATFMLVFGVVACDTAVEIPAQPDSEPKTFKVRLGVSGEIDITQNPLTRFTPDDRDLYAIQVSHKPASESNYVKYAYGLFDNLDNAVIELTENYEYKFEVLLIDDAKDKIYCDSILVDNKPYIGYSKPFRAYNKYHAADNTVSKTRVTNEFIIAKDRYFEMGSNYDLANGKATSHPENIDVYYGTKTGFTPEVGVTELYIHLYRQNYGLKVEVGDFLDEGTLNVSYYDYERTLTPENRSFETTFAFYAWQSSTTASTDCYFSWIKADGSIVKWDRISVSFERLKQTVVKLNYYGDDDVAGNNSLVFTYEDTPIEEVYKEYTHGEDQGDYEW